MALEPADEIVITTLVDNVYDGLLITGEVDRTTEFEQHALAAALPDAWAAGSSGSSYRL